MISIVELDGGSDFTTGDVLPGCNHRKCIGEDTCLRVARVDANLDTLMAEASVAPHVRVRYDPSVPVNLGALIKKGVDAGLIAPQKMYP